MVVLDCIVMSIVVGVLMVRAVRAVRIISIKVGQHSSNRTMYLNSRLDFVVEKFIIPSFPDES
jgi:hypothetical protein